MFAPTLNRRFEKKRVFILSLFAAGMATSTIFCLYMCLPDLLSIGAIAGVALSLFVAGAACGTLNVTQSSMIADTVDLTEYETGIRPDGVFFSGLTTVNKFSVGITALITGATYARVGFSGDGVRAVNDALNAGASFAEDPSFSAFRFAMYFLMCIPPTIGFIVSSIPIFRYKLTNKRRAEIECELSARKTRSDDEDKAD